MNWLNSLDILVVLPILSKFANINQFYVSTGSDTDVENISISNSNNMGYMSDADSKYRNYTIFSRPHTINY